MYKVLLVFFSFTLAGLLIYGSFASQENIVTHPSSTLSQGNIGALPIIEYPPSSGSGRKVFHYTFSSLAGAFFWTPNNAKVPGFSLSGKVINYQEGNTLFSLYDPFILYTLQAPGFRIEEITNGSIYIGKEDDGTYSIYSVDSVARFYFTVAGEEMTDIILFPGYYLRFDPAKNADLKGADLLRTIILFDKSESTGLQFLNPRSTKTSSPFASSVLGSAPLLQALQYYLKSHADDRNTLEQKYNQQTQLVQNEPDSILFLNEEKKNYFYRLHLQAYLTSIVDPASNVDKSIREIEAIYNASSARGTNHEIQEILRDFMKDARFVIYGGVLGNTTDNSGKSYDDAVARYDKMYQAIAKLLGITPTTLQTKIFQRLSDVYLDNMLNLAPLDAYYRVAQVLERTLGYQEGLLEKDYLDISLYAENILVDSFLRYKIEKDDKGMPGPNIILLPSTYSLISTVFDASKKYYSNPSQAERRDTAISAFASQLYIPIMNYLLEGVNNTFVTQSDGKYLLQSSYIKPDGSANIDRNIYNGIKTVLNSLDDAILNFSNVADRLNERENLISNYSRLVNLSLQLKQVSRMMEDYRSYIRNPIMIEPVLGELPEEDTVTQESSTDSGSLIDDPEDILLGSTGAHVTPAPVTTLPPPQPAISEWPEVIGTPQEGGVVDYIP